MATIYIVDRDSADGPENDCFLSLALAQEWAAHIGGTVREENTINRALLQAMKRTRNTKWEECECCGCEHPTGYTGDCRNDEMRR